MADFFNRLEYVNSSTIKMFLNYDSGLTGINTEYYDINGNVVRDAWRLANPSRYHSIFTSTGYNITGLYNHSTNPIRIKGYYSGSSGNYGVQNIWITGTDVSYIYSSNVTKTSMTVYWYDPAEYGRFAVEIYDPYGRMIDYDYYLSPDYYGKVSFSVSGLTAGTRYRVKAYAVGYVKNGTPREQYFTTDSPQLPTSITTLNLSASSSANTITASWNNVSYESGYRIELFRGASTNPSDYNFIKSKSTTGTSISFYSSDGVDSYSYYTIKVYGYNSDGNGGWKADYIRTADTEAPTIRIISTSGVGRIYMHYDGSDSGIGLRSTSTYLVAISKKNGSAVYDQEYTTMTQKSFDSDADGLPFENGAWYYVGVRAYDAAGNMSGRATARIQYEVAHPGSWAWHVSKISGQPVNVTAVEWNSLTTKVNQFRTYKNLSLVDFTTVYRGQTITASIANEVRNAIAAMNPPTSPPSVVYKGDQMTAYYFNRLVQSLNSIT